ncbi:MAG: PH domain-containing protein [Myxococcales bacterium]|nr:PH domain-containing protein [Myxococcales bacterium]
MIRKTPERSEILLGSVLFCGLLLWVVYGTSYTLEKTELLVRCGPLRYRVPLADIDSVTPSRNPASSPAGSLDRVQIRWASEERSLLISPEPRAAFLQKLAQRCPQLRFDGSALVRSDVG